jgi:hypothetical protein
MINTVKMALTAPGNSDCLRYGRVSVEAICPRLFETFRRIYEHQAMKGSIQGAQVSGSLAALLIVIRSGISVSVIRTNHRCLLGVVRYLLVARCSFFTFAVLRTLLCELS